MSRGGRQTSHKQITNSNDILQKLTRAVVTSANDKIDVNGAMLAHRMPIHFGGISDPFSNLLTSKVSLRCLAALGRLQYPVVLSTKNAEQLTKEDTIALLRENRHLVVQVSITTPYDPQAKAIEPNAPTSTERIRSVETLSKAGIHTVVRLQPLILPWIDLIERDLIPALGSAGCKHVITEFLKLPVEENLSRINYFLKKVEWNAYEAYSKLGASLVGREWILPNRFKWQELKPLIAEIHRNHMTFGAGDYGLNHLGDTDCCCGIDKVPGFEGWFKGNFSNVIRNNHSDHLTFGEVNQHWIPHQSISMYVNSHSRLPSNSMLDYLKQKWNRPGTANAPDAFLGISWKGDLDQEQNCVYAKEKIL